MTGLHGIHLTIGVVIVARLAWLMRGLTSLKIPDLATIGLYWCFVDTIWIFLYPLMGWSGRAQCPKLSFGGDIELKEHTMSSRQQAQAEVSAIGIDIGKNTFHLIGQNRRGKILLRAKVSRSQLLQRLANIPRCLIGMEAGAGAHHIARCLQELGHDVRLIPAQYVKPFLKGHKNDYRDAEAIIEAVQRPTMNFVAVKTPEQCDLQALHRVRSRLVRLRTGVINQIRGLLLERGVVVAQRPVPLRKALTDILADTTGYVSPRMQRLIGMLAAEWRDLEVRIEELSEEIEALARADEACQRLMTVPGIGVIISSAVVSAIGTGGGFNQGRDFAAWLGLVPKQLSNGWTHEACWALEAWQYLLTHAIRAGRARDLG